MSEVNFRNKGPQPQVHNNEKLQFRQGSPAHYQPTTTSSKTEMRPIGAVHTMGAKSAVPPAHLAGGGAPTRGAAPSVIGQPQTLTQQSRPPKPGAVNRAPVKPGAVVAAPVTAAPVATAPLESRLISPEGALLLGQIAEMFIAAEQFSGRGDTELVKLAVKTLTDMQPLFPPGVTIPIPNVSPPAGEQGPSVVMVPLPPVAAVTPTDLHVAHATAPEAKLGA